jgi:hypothetical protein
VAEKSEDLAKLIREGFAGVHARFDALNEGVLFVGQKLLAPAELLELRRILENTTAGAAR